jgi:hypothetical protein
MEHVVLATRCRLRRAWARVKVGRPGLWKVGAGEAPKQLAGTLRNQLAVADHHVPNWSIFCQAGMQTGRRQ